MCLEGSEEVRKWCGRSHDTHKCISCHITLMLAFQDFNKSNLHRAINDQFPVRGFMEQLETRNRNATPNKDRLEQNIHLVFSACSLNTNCSDLLLKRVGKSSASLNTFVFTWLDVILLSANHRDKGDFLQRDWPKRLKGQWG